MNLRHSVAIAAILLSSLVLAAPPKIVSEFSGKVISVSDGDTIKVLVGKETVTVRLEAIDAPESGQSYGDKSKKALSDAVFGKNVTVKKTGSDRYGRSLGFVVVGNTDANAKMIEDGWAWHYKEYNNEERLAKLEDAARKAKRGLWADDRPLAPWEYRARQRAPQIESKAAAASGQFWLNTSSGVRHNEKCEHFQKTKKGRLCEKAEGKPCGICGG